MRSLSSAAISALFGSQTGSVFLTLLEISHTDITTVYFVNNNEDIIYSGQTYTAYPFNFEPPKQTDSGIEPSRLVLPNIDLSIVEIIRSISTPPTIRTALIMVQPNGTVTLEDGWYSFILRNVTYDALRVSGELIFDINLDATVSLYKYGNTTFPGLYG